MDTLALAKKLCLDDEKKKHILFNPDFPCVIPKRLLDAMEKGTLDDPLFKQFVPLKEELLETSGFSEDPLDEKEFYKTEKLLHKYHGRVLLLTSPHCAMNCRFCFRRHAPEIPSSSFAKELAYIAKDNTITEVILSGGDPLSLSNEKLNALINSLNDIPHIKRIRFHTRYPIGIPERIDEGFVEILQHCSKRLWFVLHVNHANELGNDVFAAIKKIQRLGIPVLTQTVLLKGVNDNVDILEDLFSALIDEGIVPYYLHHLDKVQGAEHFYVSKNSGCVFIEELKKRLSGFAVPRYVEEIPNEACKISISLDR
ncbi:MAG: KamA family radical SAM protein [Waddliaceae bacterium]|jgi:EF-P beta-lysylation protein EpmB|nr:KamA family radical SAM protein [Waddliaceae bacterium]MBT3578883.1 KamA family radical SAM protein [Waddliaceae bacterium]MBT4445041.1 KamA family radical SAM protein [Waddliaceae bacterium]MBT6929049.1 KamA family radical SAM protein [Waddliaceae bacterium]MBT7264048.1 KamA family radical SAM protein [Waddliaceae bacterium]